MFKFVYLWNGKMHAVRSSVKCYVSAKREQWRLFIQSMAGRTCRHRSGCHCQCPSRIWGSNCHRRHTRLWLNSVNCWNLYLVHRTSSISSQYLVLVTLSDLSNNSFTHRLRQLSLLSPDSTAPETAILKSRTFIQSVGHYYNRTFNFLTGRDG